MGTTESLLYDEQPPTPQEQSTQPPERRTGNPSTGPQKGRPVRPKPVKRMYGLVLGGPKVGKHTLLQRLLGRDPYAKSGETPEAPPQHAISIPYKPPKDALAWDRIQLEIACARTITRRADFLVILIQPAHNLEDIQAYILQVLRTHLGFLGYGNKEADKSTLPPICIQILVNFRDLSGPHQEVLSALEKFIQDLVQELPAPQERILSVLGPTSLRNCYGLDRLHDFIYKTYLIRKQAILESQLKAVRVQFEKMSGSDAISYEDFLSMLESENGDDRPPRRAPIQATKNVQKAPKADKVPKSSKSKSREGEPKEKKKTVTAPAKKQDRSQDKKRREFLPKAAAARFGRDALEAFLESDSDEEQAAPAKTSRAKPKAKAPSRTATVDSDDDDDDDFFYDESGRFGHAHQSDSDDDSESSSSEEDAPRPAPTVQPETLSKSVDKSSTIEEEKPGASSSDDEKKAPATSPIHQDETATPAITEESESEDGEFFVENNENASATIQRDEKVPSETDEPSPDPTTDPTETSDTNTNNSLEVGPDSLEKKDPESENDPEQPEQLQEDTVDQPQDSENAPSTNTKVVDDDSDEEFMVQEDPSPPRDSVRPPPTLDDTKTSEDEHIKEDPDQDSDDEDDDEFIIGPTSSPKQTIQADEERTDEHDENEETAQPMTPNEDASTPSRSPTTSAPSSGISAAALAAIQAAQQEAEAMLVQQQQQQAMKKPKKSKKEKKAKKEGKKKKKKKEKQVSSDDVSD